MRITEQNYISQLKIKNEKALEFVLTEYGWVVKTVAKKHLHQAPELMDECLNDVLLAVWENIDAFNENKSTFKNWIAGISRYKAIDCKRKYLRYLHEEPLESAENIAGSDDEIAAIQNEVSEELDALLRCLSEKDQIIFKMLFFNEEQVENVAKVLNLEKSAVYNHISRGKKKIQRYYLEVGKERKI